MIWTILFVIVLLLPELWLLARWLRGRSAKQAARVPTHGMTKRKS